MVSAEDLFVLLGVDARGAHGGGFHWWRTDKLGYY